LNLSVPTDLSNALIEVTIHDLARGGAGVGRLPSGEVVFVPFTAPGDHLRVRILEREKSYAHAEAVEWLTRSPLRVEPPCPAFGTCGGCTWQHLPYAVQFETKVKGLKAALSRSGFDPNTVPWDEFPASEHYHYRNRIQLRGNPSERTAGFLRNGSHEIVPITSCSIADSRINAALPDLLSEAHRSQTAPFKLEVSVEEGGGIRSTLNERHGALGFRQINDHQNHLLRKWVSDHAGSGSLLLDLFGGSGNLSLPLADRFQSILCVDSGAPDQSQKPDHFRFIKQDLRNWCREPSVEPATRGTIAIIDPPREGIRDLFDSLNKKLSTLGTKKILLIGCHVDSFVRDSANFRKAGFQTLRLGALDLFPQTPHLESLALFSK
jgi:23S rRNA (uracil1939-C5)-methyltransferase